MVADPAHSTAAPGSPGRGLLVVTGASHTGKSSVIQALVPNLDPPVAILGVDDLLRGTLVRPEGDPWGEIPLAYELIEVQVCALLQRDWLVIVESTFTYVSPAGEGAFHENVLSQIVGLAERHRAPWSLCKVETTLELALSRGSQTKRLPAEIIAATAHLHEKLELPAETVKLSTAEQTPEEAARALAKHLSASLRQK